MLTEPEQRTSPPAAAPIDDTGATATMRHAKRVRQLRLHVAAWALGTTIVTAAWIAHAWNANGAFERFAHEGNRGDWNPTLWALRVHFGRPPSEAEIDREARRSDPRALARARARLERRGRLKFHTAAWL